MEFINSLRQKGNKREQWIGYLYLAVILLFVFRLFAYLSCFHMGPWTVYGFTMATALISFIILLLLFPEFSKYEKILWIGLSVSIFISWLTHFTGLEYICNTAILLSALTILPKMEWKKLYAEILFWIFTAYVLFVLIFVNRSSTDFESLVYLNPNGTSMLIVVYQGVLVAYARKQKKMLLTILIYALAVGLILVQWQFGGRASLLGTGVLVIYCIFQKFLDRLKSRTIYYLILLSLFIAIVFAFFYSVFLYRLLGDNIPLLGKDFLTGRESIWLEAFKSLRGWKILFGTGQCKLNTSWAELVGPEPTEIHSSMVGYLTLFGVFAAVFYALVFGNLASKAGRGKRKTVVAFLGAIILSSYFETFMYSTASVLYFPIALILIYHFDNEEKKE